MTRFISVKYCILYMFSLYTIGNYGHSYSSNVDKLSTRNREEVKTIDNNMDDLSIQSQEFIKTINNIVEYSSNFKKRLMRFKENLRNTGEELKTIRDEHFKRWGEEALNNLEDKLVIARNYFRLNKDDELKDRFDTYLIDME